MGWVELKHDTCNLPSQDQITKTGALVGSTWRCGDTGCNKMYVLSTEFSLMELATIQVVEGARHAVQGLDYRDRQLAEMSEVERLKAQHKDELDKVNRKLDTISEIRSKREMELASMKAQLEEVQSKPKPFWRGLEC